MKVGCQFLCSYIAMALMFGTVSPDTVASEGARPQVMILGTFHFQGSATDGISVGMGDMLAAGRQEEIEEVIERLAHFAPTRIMLEVPTAQEADLNQSYQSYRSGKLDLSANESHQLGFRLASRLGHDRVFAIDQPMEMDFGRMMGAGQVAGQQAALGSIQTALARVQADLEDAQKEGISLLEALRFHNSDWAHRGNGLYLQMAVLGSDSDAAGAEEIGNWYRRNLHIYANIARRIDDDSGRERVLVIIGSGHLAHLSDFFEQNPSYEWVSALEYLSDTHVQPRR